MADSFAQGPGANLLEAPMREEKDGIVCEKDGEEMKEVSTTEIPNPAGSFSHKAYSCPKCSAIKMIPRKLAA
jgi:hypothetical protein